jgi:hypothetical protein
VNNFLQDFTVSLVAGIAGILIVLWIERQRRPSLTIRLGEPGEIKDGDILQRPTCKWLHVQVQNRNVPDWLGWVYHRAWITFHHLDGQRVFDREMVARWSGSDEPKVEVINIKSGEEQKQVLRLIGAQNSFDIPPGEQTDIDIVFRAKSEDNCFGWNNESYLYGWHHPDWCLEKGRYIARIRVKTGGREYINAFMIANDVRYEDFRLVEIDDETKKKLR